MFVRKRIIIEIVLVSVFIGLSLYISFNKSLWRDEAFSYLLANESYREIVTISAQDFNPPVFYILLKSWIHMLGTDVMVMRLLPLLFSIATVWILIRLKDWIFQSSGVLTNFNDSSNSGLLFSLIFSGVYYLLIISSNVFLYFSAELRPYSLLILLVLLSSLLLIRLLNHFSWKICVWFGVVQVILVYTHTMGTLWVFSQALATGFYLVLSGKWTLVKPLLITYGSVFALTFPWLLVMIEQNGRAMADFWITFDKETALSEYIGIFVGMERIVELDAYDVYIQLFDYSKFLLFAGLLYVYERVKSLKVVGFAAVVMSLVVYYYSYLVNPILYSRYLSLMAVIGVVGLFLGFVFVIKIVDVVVRSMVGRHTIWSSVVSLIVLAGSSGLYFSTIIQTLPDLLDELNRTNYKFLHSYSNLAIYTNEELDVMSCVYYAQNCTYVGDLSTTLGYVGVHQFDSVAYIENWDVIDDEWIGVVYKNYREDEVVPELEARAYQIVERQFLGDNSYFALARIVQN